MPFIHTNIKQEGKVSCCWRFTGKLDDYTKNSLRKIWNNDNIRNVRKDLIQGEKNTWCNSCWDMENSGAKSTRQQCLEDYNHLVKNLDVEKIKNNNYFVDTKNIKSIEIRFDNICNLMCRHCSPEYSSMWENAVKKDNNLMSLMKEYSTYRKQNYHMKLTDNIIKEITENFAPHLEEILIAGGEPLYHEKHYNFINNLLPFADNIMLSYNTNLSTLEYKKQNILPLWKKFRKILMRVSIDGDRNCYDYVRVNYNSDIYKVEKNIKQVQKLNNISLSATCTTSILNVTRFVDIIEYYLSLGVFFHTSIVQYPKALNIKLLPHCLKEIIANDYYNWTNNIEENIYTLLDNKYHKNIEKYKNRILKFGNNIITYMLSENLYEKEWHLFVAYAKKLDHYHKTNLLNTYPEFKPYYEI